MSINSFGLQNNPISTVILGDKCYCHLYFYRWKLRHKVVEWLVQVYRAGKCLKWDSSPSLKIHVLSPPSTFVLLSMSDTCWVHVVLQATVSPPLVADLVTAALQLLSLYPPPLCKILAVGVLFSHKDACSWLPSNPRSLTKILLLYQLAEYFHSPKWKWP